MLFQKIKKNIVFILISFLILFIFLFSIFGNNDGINNRVENVTVRDFGENGLHIIKISEDASLRLGLELFELGEDEVQSGEIEDEDGDEEDEDDDEEISELRIIPYSSIVYDLDGRTWVYTSPKKLTYLRREVVVSDIDGNEVILERKMPKGIKIVKTAVMELYGVEFGNNGSH